VPQARVFINVPGKELFKACVDQLWRVV